MCKVFEDFQCTIDVTWWWGVYDVSANPGTRSPANLMQVTGFRKNVARAWTRETAIACGQELSEDLPSNQ